MKKIFTTFLLAVITSFAIAQNATLKIKFVGATAPKVTIQLPLEGTLFYPNRQDQFFDQDSTLMFSFDAAKIANIYIKNSGKTFRFLVEPGQASLRLNLNNKIDDAIVYQGKNQDGQIALNKKNDTFYQYRASNYLKLDSTVNGLIALMDADKAKELQVFKALLAQKKISQPFYNEIKNDIEMDYLATATAIPIQLFFDSARPNSKAVFKPEFKEWWGKLYATHPFTNLDDLRTTEFYYHAQYYADFYLGMYFPQQNGTYVKPDFNDVNARLKVSYDGFAKNFSGKIREYLMASFLYNEILQERYQPILLELLADFKKQYPNSKFYALIKPGADKIIAYHESAKRNFTADQKFVANYAEINTLDDLMAEFKGKTVFVDIWATWCGPCKAEFEYGEELEKFLKSKNADMLYISMDKDLADAQWKEMIKYYKLAGSHIRVNPKLLQNLMDKLWDGKGYSIPRYLILKDGKLVNDKALRPSDKDKLYQQISTHL